MPIPTPGCCDGPNELLRKILEGLPFISTGTGSPIAVYDEGILLTSGVISINIVGAGISATVSGNDVTLTVPGATASTLQSGSEAIGNGLDAVSVVFPTPYAGIPSVVAIISRPVADGLILVNIDEASITALGFSATLGSATPNGDYKIKWMANL